MKILVVSGFLGAGKTTFIKEMIRKTKKPLVILENEYGETDLDIRDLNSTSPDLNVMEFMEGCVCCSKKDTFANSLIAISASLDPEYLVVEPTGVGKLGNILNNINRVVWEQIELLKPVVIVSPGSFFATMNEYREICENQLMHAAYVVYSKIENLSEKEILNVSEKINKINPDAKIIDTPYKELKEDWFNGLLSETSGKVGEGYKDTIGSFDIEENAKESPEIDQFTLKKVELISPDKLIILLEDILCGYCGSIPRAKGVLKCADEWIRFDLADGLYTISGCPEENPVCQCVFIGNTIDRDRIFKYFDAAKGNPSPIKQGSKTLPKLNFK